jgi:transcription elongation factor Elf1
MTSQVRPRELFTCPKCGIIYRAICEQQSSEQNGRFDCIDCRTEVHSWSGTHDYTGWKAVVMKPITPREKL